MNALRRLLARVWPVMRLRTLMFGVLLFVAALPGVAAITLRVYENALVRRTEAELIAQASALAATAAIIWPGAKPAAMAPPPPERSDYDDRAISTNIDLRSSTVLGERPDAAIATTAPDADAALVAGRMAPVVAATKKATLASILLLDRRGIILNGRDAGRSFAALAEVRHALSGESATVLRENDAYTHRYPLRWLSRGTDIRLHHAQPIVINGQPLGVVLVSRSPRALFRGMWEDRGKIAAGSGAIFLLLIAMTAVLARTIVRPIEALSRATRALAQGRDAAPPQPSLRVREIDGLIDDFASMAAAIAQRSHYLRDFAAALAHEFKTPLTGLRGGIELLQDHGNGMSHAERAGFLANMAGDVDRLNRLISRLMELARADMSQPARAGRCALPALLARLRDGLSREAFAIVVTCPEAMAAIAIDTAALETVLTTLIENAYQSSASQIVISVTQSDARAQIRLADNGPGIPASDADRIFEPFFTSKRAQGGTGLGLPIARALIEGNRGQLHYLPDTKGAQFEIMVPLAT